MLYILCVICVTFFAWDWHIYPSIMKGVSHFYSGIWTPDNIPDPLIDFGSCNMHKPSYLCDPDGILSFEERLELDKATQRMTAVTLSGNCLGKKKVHLEPYIYIFKSINNEHCSTNAIGTCVMRDTMHHFAKEIHEKISARNTCDGKMFLIYVRDGQYVGLSHYSHLFPSSLDNYLDNAVREAMPLPGRARLTTIANGAHAIMNALPYLIRNGFFFYDESGKPLIPSSYFDSTDLSHSNNSTGATEVSILLTSTAPDYGEVSSLNIYEDRDNYFLTHIDIDELEIPENAFKVSISKLQKETQEEKPFAEGIRTTPHWYGLMRDLPLFILPCIQIELIIVIILMLTYIWVAPYIFFMCCCLFTVRTCIGVLHGIIFKPAYILKDWWNSTEQAQHFSKARMAFPSVVMLLAGLSPSQVFEILEKSGLSAKDIIRAIRARELFDENGLFLNHGLINLKTKRSVGEGGPLNRSFFKGLIAAVLGFDLPIIRRRKYTSTDDVVTLEDAVHNSLARNKNEDAQSITPETPGKISLKANFSLLNDGAGAVVRRDVKRLQNVYGRRATISDYLGARCVDVEVWKIIDDQKMDTALIDIQHILENRGILTLVNEVRSRGEIDGIANDIPSGDRRWEAALLGGDNSRNTNYCIICTSDTKNPPFSQFRRKLSDAQLISSSQTIPKYFQKTSESSLNLALGWKRILRESASTVINNKLPLLDGSENSLKRFQQQIFDYDSKKSLECGHESHISRLEGNNEFTPVTRNCCDGSDALSVGLTSQLITFPKTNTIDPQNRLIEILDLLPLNDEAGYKEVEFSSCKATEGPSHYAHEQCFHFWLRDFLSDSDILDIEYHKDNATCPSCCLSSPDISVIQPGWLSFEVESLIKTFGVMIDRPNGRRVSQLPYRFQIGESTALSALQIVHQLEKEFPGISHSCGPHGIRSFFVQLMSSAALLTEAVDPGTRGKRFDVYNGDGSSINSDERAGRLIVESLVLRLPDRRYIGRWRTVRSSIPVMPGGIIGKLLNEISYLLFAFLMVVISSRSFTQMFDGLIRIYRRLDRSVEISTLIESNEDGDLIKDSTFVHETELVRHYSPLGHIEFREETPRSNLKIRRFEGSGLDLQSHFALEQVHANVSILTRILAPFVDQQHCGSEFTNVLHLPHGFRAVKISNILACLLESPDSNKSAVSAFNTFSDWLRFNIPSFYDRTNTVTNKKIGVMLKKESFSKFGGSSIALLEFLWSTSSDMRVPAIPGFLVSGGRDLYLPGSMGGSNSSESEAKMFKLQMVVRVVATLITWEMLKETFLDMKQFAKGEPPAWIILQEPTNEADVGSDTSTSSMQKLRFDMALMPIVSHEDRLLELLQGPSRGLNERQSLFDFREWFYEIKYGRSLDYVIG